MLGSREERPRALELLLLAHLAADRRCLKGRTPPDVSRACRRVVKLLRSMPTSVPFDVDCVIAYAEYQHTEPTGVEPDDEFGCPWDRIPAALPEARAREIVDMVGDAAQLTTADLTYLSRETVLTCLGAVVIPKKSKLDRMLDQVDTVHREAPAA